MNIQMKTFTYQQAIAELDRIFGTYKVTDKVDTRDTLEVYFTTADGQELLLLANPMDYFQKITNYEIIEA
jgi:hypothetical protein